MKLTTEYSWDCECESGFIHSKTETSCERCQAEDLEVPDSLTTEVISTLLEEK